MSGAAPRRTRIKFCGMRRPRDVEQALILGVDAIGFVCVPESPRCVTLPEVAQLRRTLRPFVACVALLRNPSVESVREVLERLRPDLLQFHGDESDHFCRQFGVPYIKAIAMGGAGASPTPVASHPQAAALLLDGHAPGQLGGRGATFDWRAAATETRHPLILAGGLTPENVAEGVAALHPYAVDVSSGIEPRRGGKPGDKDWGRMEAFVEAVRRADLETSDSPTRTN